MLNHKQHSNKSHFSHSPMIFETLHGFVGVWLIESFAVDVRGVQSVLVSSGMLETLEPCRFRARKKEMGSARATKRLGFRENGPDELPLYPQGLELMNRHLT